MPFTGARPMKTIILAGGFGSRLEEETTAKPKPMVEIGGKPLLWHVMSIYAQHGFSDFVVACGYRADVIKAYFHSFFVHNSDWTINLKDGTREELRVATPDWRITLVDTGLHTMTGGRIRRLRDYIGDQRFMATYGDGVGNVDIRGLLAFHEAHGKLATVTAVRPPARFGGIELDGDRVGRFSEKPQASAGWINGGFFVFEPGIFDYLLDDETSLERAPLEQLAAEGELMAFRHTGFWQPMDTLREKRLLESLWHDGTRPWLQP